jgi:hypothetical protein
MGSDQGELMAAFRDGRPFENSWLDLTDISQMTSSFVEIVPLDRRRGDKFFSAAI